MSGPLFDVQHIAEFLQRHGLGDDGSMQIHPLSGGQSNPTYVLSSGAWRCVLRTKPAGQLQPSAHAIDREYRVMSALQDSCVPVPRMLAYCDDPSVVGRDFYLMEFIDGRVFVDQSLPGLQPAQRGAIYDEMNRVIAALHAVDYQAAGLEDYGKPGSYFHGANIAGFTRVADAMLAQGVI